MPKYMPGEMYAEVYGEYVPRLCVDTVVLAPGTTWSRIKRTGIWGLVPYFDLINGGGLGNVALVQRDIPPEIHSWHMPGGAVYKGESIEKASKRHVLKEFGVEIDFIGELPRMEFFDEEGQVEIDGVMRPIRYDTMSFVLLAKARSRELRGSKEGTSVGWFSKVPNGPRHTKHIPYLLSLGLLVES